LAVGEETRGSDKTPGRAAVITTLILLGTYVLVAYAVQAFAGFGDEDIGLNNEENVDDVLTILGEPVAGSLAAALLLLTVSVSALSSTQTTILPTARGTLSMAVYEAIPKRFAYVHPRYMTPAFGTLVMGVTALCFYLVLPSSARMHWPIRLPRLAWRSRSITASPHTPACGTSGAACSRRPETCSCAAFSRCSVRWP
jgi:amino acid transporter